MEENKKCPLCGYEFTKSGMEHECKHCPMGGCDLICCPNCNYQFVEDSKIVRGIREGMRKILKRGNEESDGR